MILLLLGCAESTYSDGLIEDLTVMGAITEPARYVPGLPLQVEVVTANPDRLDVELLTWMCVTDEAGDCLWQLDRGAVLLGPIVDEAGLRSRVELPSATPIMLNIWSSLGIEGVALWSLACERDACPIFDEVRTAYFSPDLLDPVGLASSLPMGRSSLAVRALEVGNPLDSTSWGVNPTVHSEVEVRGQAALGVDAQEVFQIDYAVGSADDLLYGFWDAYGQAVDVRRLNAGEEGYEGRLSLIAEAPDEAGPAMLYLLLRGPAGGLAVHTQPVIVRD